MKHLFVKVAAACPEMKIADPAFNAKKIIEVIEAQAKEGTEILVFPEHSLSGYTCGDLFLQQTLIDGCLAALQQVAAATKNIRMLVFVGLPFFCHGELYNCAAALSNGRVLGLIPKTHLPNYSEFYEARHFTPAGEEILLLDLNGDGDPAIFARNLLIADEAHPEVKVACEICEDLWVPVSPATQHAQAGATIIVNLSASNEIIGKSEYRKQLVAAQSGKNACAYIYSDAGVWESTSDMVFAGHHLIYESGSCLAEAKPFSGEICVAEIDVGLLLHERRRMNTFLTYGDNENYSTKTCAFIGDGDITLRAVDPLPFVPHGETEKEQANFVLELQAQALARRLKHVHAKTAVLGVSGGLDSTLALLVACRAFDIAGMDRKGILGYTMPGFGTTKKTKSNAVVLMEELGITTKTVPITDTVLSHFKDIGHDPANRDVTYENAQARYRTMILMDVANATGGLVVGTGDLSELALGWCTFNGDHMSMYSVNASIPKTLVKCLVRAEAIRLGGRVQEVLQSILGTDISPELLPPDEKGNIAQKTESLIGPYEVIDFYLYHFLRLGDGPAKTLYLAERAFAGIYDRASLKGWLIVFYKRFFSQQFKRNCVPDGVKTGSVSLSPRGDLRMPSDASPALWIAEAESL